MNPLTRYKLTALALFFVLFTAYFLQFVKPYYVHHDSWPGKYSDPVLAYNLNIFLLALLAAVLYVGTILFYLPIRQRTKFLPLVGALVLLVLLFYIHHVNRPDNLDRDTYRKMMEHLGGYG